MLRMRKNAKGVLFSMYGVFYLTTLKNKASPVTIACKTAKLLMFFADQLNVDVG